jgi:hypothetical protein
MEGLRLIETYSGQIIVTKLGTEDLQQYQVMGVFYSVYATSLS